MGSLIGKAVSLTGQTISVAFIADKFEDNALPPIVSISTQMDGGAEYTPLKGATASISFLTDGAELMGVLRADYPIRVSVDNAATQTTIFRGYIVPNSYNQSLSGVNDTVTVECVDCLGYAKYIPYRQQDEAFGFEALRLDNLILRCLTLIGVDTTSGHELVMIPDSVRVWRGTSSMLISRLYVAENYCFNSEYPDEVTGDYRPQAKTCEQVLSMIAESFRLTWVAVNSDIYLCDMLSREVNYTDLVRGGSAHMPVIRDIVEGSFASTTCNVSTLARVALTEVKHERAETVQAQQNPFDTSTLHKDGDYDVYYDATVDAYNRVISVPLRSSIYSTYMPSRLEGNPGCYSQFVAWRDNGSVVPEPGSPHFLDDYAWSDGSWDVSLKLYDIDRQPLREFLRRKVQYVTPAVGNPRGLVKNAARTLNIAAEVAVAQLPDGEKDSDGSKTAAMKARLWPQNAKSIDCKLLVSVILNGLYYDRNSRSYVTGKVVFPVQVYADGTAQWDIYSIFDDEKDGIPLPSAGQIELVIYSNGEYDAGWDVAWLKKLELTIKSDTYALREDLLKPSAERVGSWDFNRTQSITLPFDLYYNLTPMPLSVPLVDGSYGGEARLEYDIDGQELTLCQYAHALANMGDRLMWEMALRDEANAITALDAFTCTQLWSGRKVVAGYQRDIINNSITLTLI